MIAEIAVDITDLNAAVEELAYIPGIGPKVGMMLAEIGISDIFGLMGQNPERLYEKICESRGEVLDRCVLYHFRCAVYFASNETHVPELLKWWNWK